MYVSQSAADTRIVSACKQLEDGDFQGVAANLRLGTLATGGLPSHTSHV
jgi:hypothetical protein